MRVGKVYKNILDSDYAFNFQRFTFYFSSKFYIEKFKKELYNYIDIERLKLNNKYGVELESTEYLALSLYKKIEKRGFRVKFMNKYIKENHSFTITLSFLNNIGG